MFTIIKAAGNYWLCQVVPGSKNRYRAVALMGSRDDAAYIASLLGDNVVTGWYEGPARVQHLEVAV